MQRTAAALVATLLLLPFTAPGADTEKEIVLELDHVTGKWNSPAGLTKDGFQVDLNGVPTLFLSTKAKLSVRVINTNPLLFSVTPGDAKAEDVSGLKDLQDFVTRLGGVLGKVVSVTAELDHEKKSESREPRLAMLTTATNTFVKLKEALAEAACVGETITQNRRAIVMFLNEIESVDGPKKTLAFHRVSPDPSFYFCVPMTAPTPPIDVETATVAVENLEKAGWALLKSDVPHTGDGAVDAKAEAVLKDVETLLKDSGLLITGAAEIQTFVARMEKAGIKAGSDKTFSYEPEKHGRIDLPIESTAVRWNQKITRPLKLRVDSSFAKDVATRRKELDVSFATAWRGGTLLGVGVGMVYTPLTAPTWSAAAKPGDSTVKVVTKTDEESRAGTFGLFLNVRAAQAIWPSTARNYFVPALQIGTGFDPNKPSLFAGLAWEPGIRYVRLGVGCTWQQVKRLNGQSEGDVVNGDSDIKTRDGFDHAYYLSLIVAIDNLSLFNKPN